MIAPGARLGAFEVLAALGAGGQGAVYLARPWVAGAVRRAASRRLLQARLAFGPLGGQRARRLGLAALKVARLGMADSLHDEHCHLALVGGACPGLASLYSDRAMRGAGPDLGFTRMGEAVLPFLALAYEPGVPLSRLLAAWGRARPPLAWSLAVVAQLAEALAHLHGLGLVHHDVRPANLLIRPGPRVVLLDLGAAERVGATSRRAVYGAIGWLPPERVGARPAPAVPAVDIYAVGLLLQVLTAGRPRPPGLARLIAEASAADPARRRAALPSAEALLERLASLV